jgi:hypothetical protein
MLPVTKGGGNRCPDHLVFVRLDKRPGERGDIVIGRDRGSGDVIAVRQLDPSIAVSGLDREITVQVPNIQKKDEFNSALVSLQKRTSAMTLKAETLWTGRLTGDSHTGARTLVMPGHHELEIDQSSAHWMNQLWLVLPIQYCHCHFG